MKASCPHEAPLHYVEGLGDLCRECHRAFTAAQDRLVEAISEAVWREAELAACARNLVAGSEERQVLRYDAIRLRRSQEEVAESLTAFSAVVRATRPYGGPR